MLSQKQLDYFSNCPLNSWPARSKYKISTPIKALGSLALIALAMLSAPVYALSLNFDDVPNAKVINTWYSANGVTFSNPIGGNIYARTSSTNASTPNVVSVFQTGVPAFNALYGAVDATFTTLQKSVSIDAAALRLPEGLGTPQNRPFLEAYDSNNVFLGRVLFQGPLPGAGGITPFETLTFTSASTNIKKVRFSSQQSQPGPSVFGFFDNLSVANSEFVYDEFIPKEWLIKKEGTGPTILETKQALQITLPATSADSVNGVFMGGYDSTCKLNGDFDIRVSFNLPTFPAQNGVRVGLAIPGLASVERDSWSAHDVGVAGEYFLTNIGGSLASIPTTQNKGQLRLTRTGNLAQGYFLNASSNWQSIGSGIIDTGDLNFTISAWSHNFAFNDQKVVVLFDDVIISKGTLTGAQCPFK